MRLNGSQIVIKCLEEQGVDTVFGYPGGCILNIYDELYKNPGIKHILTSHEQGASHAADGYARATGKVGVCMATSGPGATNLVTGIATAMMDSVPIVAITANVGVGMLGKDSFQEVDIAGVCMPITKYSTIVKDVKKLADTLRRAFVIAKSGRPGPVLVDITKDVTAAMCEYEPKKAAEVLPQTETIEDDALALGVEMINDSKRPMIMVGGGCVISDAACEIAELAEKLNAPVTDTLMGQGAFDQTKDQYVGMIGMHGTKAANFLTYDCDLLIALGTRFSDRVAGSPSNFAKQAAILQIDIDAAEIDKNVMTSHAIIGDVKEALKRMLPDIKEQRNEKWIAEVAEKKAAFTEEIPHDHLTGPYIMEKIYDLTNGGALITTDVGQHQMWAAQHYKYTQVRTFLSSGGLGTMGYGLGASIGAQIGRPDKRVINITGDGCFRMNMNEIATAARNNTPVITVVINNHVLGMVRQWQTLFYGQRYSATVLKDKADFAKVADALGGKGYTVTTPEEFDNAFSEALKADGPVVLDCWIDSDEKVFPMVPGGKPNSESFDAKDLAERQG
ncbi:MAG TPA: biosynthetic-type acetolactate synthase large subunit [Lachnospiraceae bacterium]|nr:biosynthetic-type acetolactate synthase large subunit [Lachnospiraceae bacterium]